MLTEISKYTDEDRFSGLCRDINDKNTKKAFGAEAEFAVLWAISRVAHMEPQRALAGKKTPDAASDDLFLSGPSVVEVTAVSDDGIAGKEAMERAANMISNRKSAGGHLHFQFNERSYYQNNHYHRKPCADPAFALTPAIEARLRDLIKGPHRQPIRIIQGETDVLVSWHETVSPLLRIYCPMPPVAYHLQRNPIYNALKDKEEQVKGAASGTVRCVILVDAGCHLLRHLRPISPVDEIGGGQIIRHALSKLSIDVVAVVSPHRTSSRPFGIQSELFWNVTCFDRRKRIPNGEYERLEAMAKQLPRPQYEARQAREVHRQGGFSSDRRNWYFRTEFVRRGGTMTIKLSAGLLHEYLSGRIDAERFNEKAFGKKDNPFEDALKRGHSIRNIQFEPGGIDADNDYVVFDLDLDWDKLVSKKPL
jgi:hypothetical protein